jgi:hypothetical protein
MADDESTTKITILTGTYRIKGSIHLQTRARVTDYMVESRNFIALTNAEVWEPDGRQVLTAPFLDVSREHIQVVVPED